MSRLHLRFVVFVCLGLIVLVALPHKTVLRIFWPIHYRGILSLEAEAHHLDPLVLAAVVKVESSYNPNATSNKGAMGLMQIMPDTGTWIAQQMAIPNWQKEQLYNPELNIRMGAWYLSYLLLMFEGELTRALAAYNCGASNVRRWVNNGTWDGSLNNYQQIPFPETRNYVFNVMRTYHWYQWLYSSPQWRN